MTSIYEEMEVGSLLREMAEKAAMMRGYDPIGQIAIAMYLAAEEELFEAATEKDLAFATANAENARAFITSYIQGGSP